jgi:hypothetical protein
VKINPDGVTGIGDTVQPGDLSMGMIAQEFLKAEEGEEETI